jgi:hypothetical protein
VAILWQFRCGVRKVWVRAHKLFARMTNSRSCPWHRKQRFDVFWVRRWFGFIWGLLGEGDQMAQVVQVG